MADSPKLQGPQFSPPALRDNNVARARCLARVGEEPPFPIVAIVAGAGCGKSTLLRQIYDQWERDDVDRVWVALEEKDQAAEQFLELLLNGLGAIDARIVLDTAEFCGLQGASDHARCASLLASGLGDRHRQVALFLDDFQFACDGDSAQLFQHLVRFLPANVLLFIASRVTPKLSIEALKVENRLLELTWEDLAFSESEAAHFFQNTRRGPLATEIVRRIHQETEGWAAGLQLALIKVRLDEGFPESVPAFSYFHDAAQYFRTEIYSVFQPGVRRFLLRTSVLDRFNDDLAAQTAGVDLKVAKQTFEFLHDRGFFLTSLDGDGKWKRYHHLVRDFLSEIRREHRDISKVSPELAASLWFEKRGMFPESIEFAIRGSLFDRAGELVEAHAIELFNRGAAAELAAWIRRIPEKVIVTRPQLPLLLCLMCSHTRQPIDGLRLQFEKSKQMIATLGAVGHFASADQYATLATELEVADSIIKFRAGDMAGVIEHGSAILAKNLKIRAVFEASLHNVIGYSHFILGDNAEARKSLTTARDLHLSAGCVFGVVFAECFRGMVDFAEGATVAAQRQFASAYEYAVSELGEDSLPASIAKLYSYVLRYEVNDLIEVEEGFDRVLRDCRYCCEPEIYANALVVRHLLFRWRNSSAEARAALDEATDYAREIGNRPIYLQVRYTAIMDNLGAGSISSAIGVFNDSRALWDMPAADGQANWNRMTFWRDLFCGEVLLATAQPRKAAEIYRSLGDVALKHNRIRRLVLMLTKCAIALASAGRNEDALAEMQRALRLARSSRFARTILDCGPRAVELLHLCRAQLEDVEDNLFIDSLIGAGDRPGAPIEPGRRMVLGELTAQEVEILRVLTAGAKNQEICRALNLSENTIKWYMTRIFEKLGAKNRTEAALIAKSMFAAL